MLPVNIIQWRKVKKNAINVILPISPTCHNAAPTEHSTVEKKSNKCNTTSEYEMTSTKLLIKETKQFNYFWIMERCKIRINYSLEFKFCFRKVVLGFSKPMGPTL